MNTKLYYLNGLEMMLEDVALINDKEIAYVKKLILPGTKEVNGFSAPDGGFLLEFEDGDGQVWDRANEDIQFVRRCCNVHNRFSTS